MRRYLLLAIGLLLTGLYLFPLYWMYVSALKSGRELFSYPPRFIPHDIVWSVGRVFVQHNMATYLSNSFLIAGGVTVICVVLGTGAARVLVRYRSLWVDAALFAILMMQVLPSSLMVTPLFVGFSELGLLKTPRLAVVLAQVAKVMPFYIVIARASLAQIPQELEDAALVDGASRIGAFLRIILPLARNGILVTAILVFLQSFGEYVYARSMISQDSLQTATVGLSSFLGPNTSDWNGIMTYSAIYVTPILLVFVLLQRRIVSGLTAGALK
ncbi:MAG: carbohydrate ABC transporter permease [Proteobacteria bacterium]|nr:carbohydrate ABC transporter permease [Pseudomonadota bacterium]